MSRTRTINTDHVARPAGVSVPKPLTVTSTDAPSGRSMRPRRNSTAPVPSNEQDPFLQIALKESKARTSRKQELDRYTSPLDNMKHNSRVSVAPASKTAVSTVPGHTYSSPLPPVPPKDVGNYVALEPARSSPHHRYASADFTARDSRMRALQHTAQQRPSVSPPTVSTTILDAPLGSRRASTLIASSPTAVTPSDPATLRLSMTPQSAHPHSAPPPRQMSSRRPSGSFEATARETSPLRSQADGTESVVSTTAPSTVWDELGELKSRIRKLELGGSKRKPSVAPTLSHMDSTDRPRTSTTQTTNDSSPFMSQQQSPKETSDLHPLLRQALGKARSRLDLDVYRYLEAVAFDALELAAMARSADLPDSMSTITSNTNDPRSERRLRRKADNLCRGLTELSIALCEGKAAGERGGPTRPVSRDNTSQFSARSAVVSSAMDAAPFQLEGRGHLPNGLSTERRPSERLISRFQSRRGSASVAKSEYAEGLSPLTSHSFRRNSHFSPSATEIQPGESEPTLRGPPSRAMTEIMPQQHAQTSDSSSRAFALSSHLRPLQAHSTTPSDSDRHSRSTSTNRTARVHSLRLDTDRDDLSRASGTSVLSPGGTEVNGEFGEPLAAATSAPRRLSSARRPPPSAAANLAERLDAKRQQRGVASAQQLAGLSSPTRSSPSGNHGTIRRPQSSGRDAVRT